MAEEQDRRKEAVKQILTYFLINPEVADSFDGIARWRMLETMIHRNLDETEEALRWLIRERYLQEREVPGSKSVFALNPDRKPEAERLVKEGQQEK